MYSFQDLTEPEEGRPMAYANEPKARPSPPALYEDGKACADRPETGFNLYD